jgi:hypothetical protein
MEKKNRGEIGATSECLVSGQYIQTGGSIIDVDEIYVLKAGHELGSLKLLERTKIP